MRSLRRSFFLLALGSALLAASVSAQPGITSNPARELERTDRILERAQDQVGVSESGRAQEYLRKAIDLQAQAVTKYDPRDQATWRPAYQLTMSARDLARRALETAEIDVKAHESIRDLIDSTRDLAQDATSLVHERGDPEAVRLLDGGLYQLQRAEDAYRTMEYRKAIGLASSARDLVQRAMQRARGDAPGSVAAVEAAIDRTQAVIEEVRLHLEDAAEPRARGLLDDAIRLQTSAIQMQQEQRAAIALRLTTQARQLALEALLLVADKPEKDDVERALSVVDQLIQDTSSVIASSGSKEAAALLDSARQRESEARLLLSQGKPALAIASARIAEALLHRAAEMAGER
jgi:hypothetical protein